MKTWKAGSGGVRAVIVVLGVTLATLAPTASANAADAVVLDGTSSEKAAASCWEIQQNTPASPSGRYWLLTPQLQAPEQFYCDMTTDGGGWVLVGRGRENWRMQYEGRGTPAQVSSTVTGTAAFDARQLSSKMIDGLLGGGRVDGLEDGIRIRRATNTSGSEWQEVRVNLTARDRWAWTLGAEHPIGAYSFDQTSGSGGTVGNFGTNSLYNRVDFREREDQNWTRGFGYGSGVSGTSATSSYLWSATDGRGYARPFAQVYLRPKITSANLNFTTIPDSGTPKSELSQLLGNGILPGAWGVTGLANGRSGEVNTEVAAIEQIGSVMYVGGNFRYVQKGANATGADKVEQPYLAAFDASTGAWVPAFKPTLNGQVKSLAALPNGYLVAGGEFSAVNSKAAGGVVALNAQDGSTATDWKLTAENRITGGVVNVRALEVKQNFLYLGGSFTHLTGGTSTSAVYARHGARVNVASGAPDTGWNPQFNGGVWAMDPSASGSRLFAAGYFTTVKGASAVSAAALTTTDASLVPVSWTPTWSASANYQQAIKEVGNDVWVGGSEHSLFVFDTQNFQRRAGTIGKAKGDFQDIEVAGGMVYAGSHGNEYMYADAYTWPTLSPNWDQADKYGWLGAFDPATGYMDPEFDPILNGRGPHGAWAITAASNGDVWVGGDFINGVNRSGATQWAGGFVRFAQRDTTAPTVPSSLTRGAQTESTVRLDWGASTDASGAVWYEVLRGDRVVAVSTSRSATFPTNGDERYFVRAVDASGNRSASTAVLNVSSTPDPDPDPDPGSPEVVPFGSSWKWRYDGSALPSNWNQTAFSDAGWASSTGPLGFGSTRVATNIDVPSGTTRPLSAQFRRTVELSAARAAGGATVQTVADDGVVVYVNGVEVGRANMPAGTIGQNTYPTAALRTTAAFAAPVSFTVPASVLHEGANTIAVSTHLGWRATPDVSFDLKMTTTG